MRYAIGMCMCAVTLVLVEGCARPGAVEEAQKTLNADVLVRMSGVSFVPKHVTIKAGQSVEWNNTAALETHTVTADPELAKTSTSVALPAGAATFNSGDLKPGQTFRYVFTVPGTYRYFCIPHERMGMIGEVEVVAVPAAQP